MKKQKTSCRNCFGMKQVERGSAGPIDCPACKGKGYVEIFKRVDHYEKGELLLDKIDGKETE